MSSKTLITTLKTAFVAAALALLGLQVGCIKLNMKPPAAAPPDLNVGAQAQCITQRFPVFVQFINGTANPQDLSDTWDCLTTAVTIYRNYVRGQADTYYLPREIANFFETYFLKDVKISDEFLTQLMKIKILLVGGTEDKFTMDEIQALEDTFGTFKAASLQILPYMKIFSINWARPDNSHFSDDFKYFEAGNVTIQMVVKQVAGIFTQQNQSYDLSNLKPLLIEMAKIADANWSIVQNIDQYLPLIYNLKNTLTGTNGQIVAGADWNPFFNLGARGYTQYLRYYYFIETNDQPGGSPELVFLAKALDDLVSFLGDMLLIKPSHQLTRAELLADLQCFSNIFPKFKISDAFLLQTMKLKTVIFGGNVGYFSSDDFIHIRTKVDTYRNILERVYLYLPIYTSEWDPSVGDDNENLNYFLESETNLESVFNTLATLMENPYDINDFQNFITELNNLYPNGLSRFKALSGISKYIPTVIGLKEALFSDASTVVGLDQWANLFNVGGRLVGRYLQFNYYVLNHKKLLSYGFGLDGLHSFVTQAVTSINAILDLKPNSSFANSDLAKLALGLNQSGILPSGFDNTVITNLLSVLTNRILLSPEDRLIQGGTNDALTKKATAIILSEWTDYYSLQKYFDTTVFKSSTTNQATRQQIYADFQTNNGLDPILNAELQSVFSTPIGRPVDSLNRLTISYDDKPYDLPGMFWQTFARTIARVLIRSYAEDITRIYNYQGINLAEWQTAVNDLKALFVASGLTDSISATFAQSRFTEASLFTPRSSGSTLASFTIITDYALNIFSGIALHNLVNAQLAKETDFGCQIVTDPMTKVQSVSVSCVAEVFHKYYGDIFASMPYQVAYAKTLARCPKIAQFPWILDSDTLAAATPAEIATVGESNISSYLKSCDSSFDTLIVNFLFAGGYTPDYSGMIKLDDLALVPHAMQYTESSMQRFDLSHTGYFDKSSVDAAYPVYKSVLARVSNQTNDTILKGLLAWYLINGTKPTGTLQEISFFFFAYTPGTWKIHASRERVAQILAAISNAETTPSAIINLTPPPGFVPPPDPKPLPVPQH